MSSNTTILVKDGAGANTAMLAVDNGDGSLSFVHYENQNQRDALLAAFGGLSSDAKLDILNGLIGSITTNPTPNTLLDRVKQVVDVIGPITETAPASDTSNTSIAGRLMRIANTNSVIASRLPPSLGAKVAANSISFVFSTEIGSLGVTGAFWQNTQPVSLVSIPIANGAASANNQVFLNALVGEVSSTPTTNTLLDRVKAVTDTLAATKQITKTVAVVPDSTIASSRALIVNTAGTIQFLNGDGSNSSPIFLAAGMFHPIVTTKVWANNTTAAGISAGY